MVAPVLAKPTLVLNRNWQPVRVATVARSLTLVWNDAAQIVDPADYQLYSWQDWAELIPKNDEPFIKTVRFELRVPEVIVLNRYDRVPRHTVAFSRRNLFRRDGFMCQYCGDKPARDELTIDHVLPRSQGGTSSWTNCVLACVKCNNRKANRTPAQAHMRLLNEPVKPKWTGVYSLPGAPVKSWAKFISEAYWNVELKD